MTVNRAVGVPEPAMMPVILLLARRRILDRPASREMFAAGTNYIFVRLAKKTSVADLYRYSR